MSLRANDEQARAGGVTGHAARLALACLLTAGSLVLGACADEHAVAREQAVLDAHDALAAEPSDPSEALRVARSAMDDHGDDPALREAAAAACVGLERYAEAMSHARAGLDAQPGDADLVADLEFRFGKAALGRYRGVGEGQDWSQANLALQRATTAGHHRLEAAKLLVLMQFMDGRNDLARARQFAGLIETLEPGGEAARQVNAVIAQRSGE